MLVYRRDSAVGPANRVAERSHSERESTAQGSAGKTDLRKLHVFLQFELLVGEDEDAVPNKESEDQEKRSGCGEGEASGAQGGAGSGRAG